MPESTAPARTATIAYWLAIAAAAAAVLGIVGIQLGVLTPFLGFRLFGLGAVPGSLLTLILALAGLFVTRGGRDAVGRQRALVALGIGTLLVAAVVIGGSPGAGLPPINDITTNLEEPPQFVEAGSAPENAGKDMSYPPDFVDQVRNGYPDLAPIRVAAARGEAFRRALDTAKDLGWEIVHQDPSAGVIEARETTAIFRFVDDVVVRVRSEGEGSVVDLRSRSRVGRGDVGANAARIHAFEQAFGEPNVASR